MSNFAQISPLFAVHCSVLFESQSFSRLSVTGVTLSFVPFSAEGNEEDVIYLATYVDEDSESDEESEKEEETILEYIEGVNPDERTPPPPKPMQLKAAFTPEAIGMSQMVRF